MAKIHGYYYYSRRVPEELKELDPRSIVRVSLKTECKRQAARKISIVNDQVESFWQSLLETNTQYDNKRFAQAVRISRQLGFSYKPISEVANLPIEELVQRYLALKDATPGQIQAVLGTAGESEITLKTALQKFWGFAKERTLNKSRDQIRKWENPRKKAIANLISVIGNKDLKSITRDDILAFRDWWLDRIQNHNLNSASANKDIIHVKNIIETISENLRLGLDTRHLFKKIILKVRYKQTRLPFTRAQIKAILESDKLQNLNLECRWFLFAAAGTGARPSEIVGLLPEDIRLDSYVPYIKITDRKDRCLKTTHSEREIPLVGYALKAFQKMPEGFPRYRDKPDNLTNAVNKFLRENKLLPSPNHSVYSFRHSFQDALLNVNAPDRVQAELMGHKFDRPLYGDGATLANKAEWLKKSQADAL